MSLLGSAETTASGVARDVTWHEMETPPSLSLRVEHTDDAGNVTGYTQVTAASIRVNDVVSEGDTVTVSGSHNSDGVLEIAELTNETTGVTFSPDGGELGGLVLLGPPLLGVLVGGVGGLAGLLPGAAATGALNGALEGAGMGLLFGGAVTLVIFFGLMVWGAAT